MTPSQAVGNFFATVPHLLHRLSGERQVGMQATHVSQELGIGLMVGLGVFMFAVAFAVRSMVRNTHTFVIAGRQIPLGFGVGSVIAVWTWSMAVMIGSAYAYSFGISGLLWFIVPNGLAVMVMVPFALRLRR